MSDDVLDGAVALIVDDNAGSQLFLGRWLTRAGMSIRVARSGGEGLELAQRQPDLIIADVEMPDMSGLDVTARLKADPLTQHIPIIQRSSVPIGDSARVEGLTAGADAYLVEPIREDVLVATARALVRYRNLSRQLELALSLDVTGVYDWAVPTGLVRWSESLERIHGMAVGEFGGTFDDFVATVHPDDRERITGELEAALAAADSIEIAFRFVRTDGSFGWIESRGRIFRDGDGVAVRLLGLAHDVTSREFERRRLEQLRRLASALTAARTTAEVIKIVGREVEGSNVDVALVDDDTPCAVDVTFSYLAGGQRLEVTVHPGDLYGVSRAQATAIGELAGGALDRTFRYEAERSNAVALQRALLPARLPEIAGWSIDAEYVPASADDRLGGDFYDIASLPEYFVVVLGDVAGHGLQATQQMGTVRILLRTLVASHDGEPATVLQRAAELFSTVCGVGSPFVTAIVARFHVESGRVDIASAGHPGPIVRCNGSAMMLDVQPGPPLGVGAPARGRTVGIELEAGAWLALYTDGVFETRAGSIDDAIGEATSDLGDRLAAGQLIEAGDAIVGLNLDDRAVVVVTRGLTR